MRLFRPGARVAFTLIELMVVMTIIVILLVLAVPAFNSIGKASSLTNGATAVADELKLARQIATARNRKVTMRLYKLKGEVGATQEYRAVRLFMVDDKGVLSPAASIKRLPPGIIMVSTDNFSTLLGTSNPPPNGINTENLPDAPDTPFKQIEFLPTGGTSLAQAGAQSGADKWFVTVKAETAPAGKAGMPAPNFVTVMLDPVTGRVRTFQP